MLEKSNIQYELIYLKYSQQALLARILLSGDLGFTIAIIGFFMLVQPYVALRE
jgi:hypothetical protein